MKKHGLTLIVAALAAAFSISVSAQEKATAGVAGAVASAPGKVSAAKAVKVVATVEAIDHKTREVTIKRSNGKLLQLTAGPDVRNLEQIKVGDQVVVGYFESLTLTLKKDGKELPSATAVQDGGRAASGAQPGGAVARQVEVTADVVALDAKTQTVSLKGPKQTLDLKVLDPAQFKLIKVGDQIQAVYTEALALTVEPAASAKK